MSTPKLLIDAVAHVLKIKAKAGMTTKNDAALMVLGRIEGAGGPTKFGIGKAMLIMAMRQIVETEVSRQMKFTLTDHEQKFVLPATAPSEVLAALGRVTRWIAITDNLNAIWKYSLLASPQDWIDNFRIKDKKAQQTRNRALESKEIADFLNMNGFASLADAFTKGA